MGKLTWLLLSAFSAHAGGYRVNSLSLGKIEAVSQSKGTVNFARLAAAEGTQSNSSFFISGLAVSLAGTISVSASSAGTIAATAGSAALVSNCAPTLGVITPALVAGGGFPPVLAVAIPLAVIAALALVGGLVALHISSTAALAALAFCPVSNFESEPLQALVSSQPYLAFPEDLESIMEEGLDGGMPECHGMSAATLPHTKCSPNDVDCMERACREQCCEDERCTFYQFETQPGENGNSQQVDCLLGEKHMLVDKNCEKPFFGEMCVSRLPLWPQTGESGSVCMSYGSGAFQVDDQMDCQEIAMRQHKCFYQYDADKKVCALCDDDSTMQKTSENWKTYKDTNCKAASHVQAQEICAEWAIKPVLLSRIAKTQAKTPPHRGCRGVAAPCLKKRCRQLCSDEPGCTFYQFQEEQNMCYLGTAETLADTDKVEDWHGGFVSSRRKCKSGFQCPSSSQCVDDCSSCEGFSKEGAEMKGRSKHKGRWCVRDAVQGLCYSNNWQSTYRGVEVNEWCKNMDKVTVEVSLVDDRQSGQDVCKKACCADPACKVYQMSAKDAAMSGSQMNGTSVVCMLGLETEGGKPKFKCTGQTLAKWRRAEKPVGEALKERGCPPATFACLTQRECVDDCRRECRGAPKFSGSTCEPIMTEEEEKSSYGKDSAHSKAFGDTFIHAMPKFKSQDNEAYLISDKDLDETNFQAQDTAMDLNMNIDRTPVGDLATACQSLVDNMDTAMNCYYIGDNTCQCDVGGDCGEWFPLGAKHMRHVLEDDGRKGQHMLLFTGEKCKCTGSSCTFGFLPQVPPIDLSANAGGSIQLAGAGARLCDKSKCDASFLEKGLDCKLETYGRADHPHNCGYECTNAEGKSFFCDKSCNCDAEEETQGSCISKQCSGYETCKVMDYGEYGCGLSCEDKDGNIAFCDADCDCE